MTGPRLKARKESDLSLVLLVLTPTLCSNLYFTRVPFLNAKNPCASSPAPGILNRQVPCKLWVYFCVSLLFEAFLVIFSFSHCLLTRHPVSASDRALASKSSSCSSVSVLVLFCLSLAGHLLTELPASTLGLFFSRQLEWPFSVSEITPLPWFVQALQSPPFAFRRRPAPSHGLPWPGTVRAVAHLSRAPALCPADRLVVLRLSYQPCFCAGASAPLLCTCPHRQVSAQTPWERPFLIFPNLHHSYFPCTLTVICVF